MRFYPKTCTFAGHAFWLLGLAIIFLGYGKYAWIPINLAGFAFGYRSAISDYSFSQDGGETK